MTTPFFLLLLSLCAFSLASSCTLSTIQGCSTFAASGLTHQIADELTAMGYTFKSVPEEFISCPKPCTNLFQERAAESIAKASHKLGSKILFGTTFKSSAQQFILYYWNKTKVCGINKASVPGTAPFESAKQATVRYYRLHSDVLKEFGWTVDESAPSLFFFDVPDLRKENLRAFQRLHNRHNPDQQIEEDGVFGPNTDYAFRAAPCDGW